MFSYGCHVSSKATLPFQEVALIGVRAGSVSCQQIRRYSECSAVLQARQQIHTSQSGRPFSNKVALSKVVKCNELGELVGAPLLSMRWQHYLYGKKRSSNQGKTRTCIVTATASPRDIDSSTLRRHNADTDLSSALLWADAFWRFTRPHTIIGTTLSVVSVSLLAVDSTAQLGVHWITGLLQALVPALLMNIYIVGLNQLFDIEIDKVNKPYLPLASGEFSVGLAASIVSVAAATSLAIGLAVGSKALLLTLIVSMLLGTAYSIDLPGLRWKRFPLMAAGCILAVRAIVVQLGFFCHMKFALNQPAVLSRPLIFATSFMCLFSIVIALFKDIPDLEGDREFGVSSFTVQLGQRRVFWFCISILLAAYGGAVLFGLTSSAYWSRVTTVVTHSAMGLLLWQRTQAVDLTSQSSFYAAYMFIWKLFYAEYLFLPFLR